ncbi:site-2 protease family protein [Thioalbus denitrificans]|jgi:Zn-dependent protease|uniref:Zn-dependent protease n=1 Tax=Thioalbus denitrificans TaxID=547122 RepID=A0A369BT97_9GAMM|nr:site-2 protease family protein [Thioalbus denitrificans]RCX24783.1 Zn-dependent protease [Thioalbus denitrificans]
MPDFNSVQLFAVWVLPVLFAITLHEAAHGWMARRLGDPTAEMLGRLTLNPLKHIDPVGTILVPGILLLLGSGVLFGWAKPVPVTMENLRNPRRDMAWVAAAGPLANLLMAVLWAFIIHVGLWTIEMSPGVARPLVFMGVAGVFINTILMVLNLVPIPPLDGGRVAMSLLPGPWAWKLSRLEPYGILVVLLLLVSGVLGIVIWPVISALQMGLGVISGLPAGDFFRLLSALVN